jgi:hypothetical protein
MIGRAPSSANFLSISHQLLALFLVGLGGLPVDQLVDLRITVSVIVSDGT